MPEKTAAQHLFDLQFPFACSKQVINDREINSAYRLTNGRRTTFEKKI